ncbi:Zinc finger, CCHC-type [Sesbania bispinosa]|nr:Zinc finger, CCHC-type [Sesbania bispinosa]
MSQTRSSPLIVFTEEDVTEGVDRCHKSLIGKFLTEKPVHTNSLQNALTGIWCNPKGLKVEELEPKLFQFFLEEESDLDRILRGSPWIFRNSWLVLNRWDRNIEPALMNFSTVPLKIQIWGLPFHCRTVQMGRKIGACMGTVRDSEIFEVRDRGSFIKILVDFDTTKPLLPGVNVGSRVDGVLWVDFRFERLPQFCYSCGLIGHEEDSCRSDPVHANNDDTEGQGLGPWLRASAVGRKASNPTRGEPSHSDMRARSKKQHMPKEFIDLLSSLSFSQQPDPHTTSQKNDCGSVNADKPISEGVIQPSIQPATTDSSSHVPDSKKAITPPVMILATKGR